MKRIIPIIVFIATASISAAQESFHYQDACLKTNILSPFNIGVELPIRDGFTIEYNIRRARSFVFSNSIYKDERLNLKYHFPINGLLDFKRSAYFMLGFHSKYQELNNRIYRTNQRERGVLNQNRFVYGLGMRSRKFDLWIAAERVFFERENYKTITNSDGSMVENSLWKSGGFISFGISYNIINFKDIRFRR